VEKLMRRLNAVASAVSAEKRHHQLVSANL